MAEYCTRRGRIRPLLVIAISLLAALSALVSGAPPGLKGLLLTVIALAAYRALTHLPAHLIRLESAASSGLDGVRGTLFARAATGLFVALVITPVAGRKRRAFIFRDELDPDAFRALLAFLRHG